MNPVARWRRRSGAASGAPAVSLLPLLLLSLSPALTGCGGGGAQRAARGPVPVEAATARSEDVAVTVRAVGTLRAADEAEVRAERDGRVERIAFTEGMPVRRGDLLVALDADQVEAEVSEMEARVRQAKARFDELQDALERRRPLVEKQLVSREEFRSQEKAVEGARAQVEAAEAAARKARRQLADTRIVAPVSGSVGARLLSPGDYVEKGDLVAKIYDLGDLEVAFRLPERHAGRLHPGQEVRLGVAAFPGDDFPAEITFVDPAVDPVTRTLAAKARVSNPDGRLRPGLFAQVDVVLERHEDAPVIPEEAVVPREDGDWVFVVEDGVARRRKVDLGQRMPGRVEVLRGVVSGETVVTAGQPKLADGAEVRVLEQPPAGGESSGEG